MYAAFPCLSVSSSQHDMNFRNKRICSPDQGGVPPCAFREAKLMRYWMVLLMVLAAVSGCSSDRAEDLTTCQAEADRFYQGYRTMDVDNPRSKFIISCMADKGYAFDFTPKECDSRHPLPSQPACYAANGWLAWIAHILFRD